jgi:hypothetical protein
LSAEEIQNLRRVYITENITPFTRELEDGDFHNLEKEELEAKENWTDHSKASDPQVDVKDLEQKYYTESNNDEYNAMIRVLKPGVAVEECQVCRKENMRSIHPICAICLYPYEPNEELTWSSNETCPHTFHKNCIIDWFIALGKVSDRKRKKEKKEKKSDEDIITDFDMSCPCCRQSFIKEPCVILETSFSDV